MHTVACGQQLLLLSGSPALEGKGIVDAHTSHANLDGSAHVLVPGWTFHYRCYSMPSPSAARAAPCQHGRERIRPAGCTTRARGHGRDRELPSAQRLRGR
eukprot:scaffold3210_cov402-Prasinococcus_capsulatus_cf.AAC.3